MPYEILRTPRARRDIRRYFRYLKHEVGEIISRSYLAVLEHDIGIVIANNPNTFSWFHETGEPYRAKLFKLARTTFWIVYTVDNDKRRVEIKRFWNAARHPESHGL